VWKFEQTQNSLLSRSSSSNSKLIEVWRSRDLFFSLRVDGLGSSPHRAPSPPPRLTLNSQWYYIAAIKRSLSATGSDAGQNSSLIFYTRSASRRQLLLLLSVCLSLSLYLSLYSRLSQAFWLMSTSNYNSSPTSVQQ